MNHFAAKCLSTKKSPINALQAKDSAGSDEDIIEMVSLHKEGNVMHVTKSEDTERFSL